jgi:glycosyltransferase involved in cell wall biosynthesis
VAAKPLVSLLIPAYNERFFGEALSSAVAQTYGELEIVVCDDSPGDLVGTLCRGDDRVRHVRNAKRLGFEANFTECLRQARGSLIKYLNDDDRLHPQCVARLAASFEDPAVMLATSRRRVIDVHGAAKPDIPATTPVARVSVVAEGLELGNIVLVNSLNLIGEPTTAMFRRDALVADAAGVFTWLGKSYHCLADVSLWLRVLAQGRGYYDALPLSDYRMHPGQEQRTASMGIACITERFDIVQAARTLGYLAAPIQYRTALDRIQALASTWIARGNPSPADRAALGELSRRMAAVEVA